METCDVVFVGKEYKVDGRACVAVAETDSGNVKVRFPDATEEWDSYTELKAA